MLASVVLHTGKKTALPDRGLQHGPHAMYPPQVPRTERTASVRGEQVGPARADNARVQGTVVRALVLHLSMASETSADSSGSTRKSNAIRCYMQWALEAPTSRQTKSRARPAWQYGAAACGCTGTNDTPGIALDTCLQTAHNYSILWSYDIMLEPTGSWQC